MKKICMFAGALLSTLVGLAQDGITVCHTPATEKFALFASNKEFNMAHADPLPYSHQSQVGKMVTFKTTNGADANGYLLEAKTKTNNWIFVF